MLGSIYTMLPRNPRKMFPILPRFYRNFPFLALLLFLCETAVGQRLGTLTVDNLLMIAPKAYMTYSDNVVNGAELGLEECRHQLTWEKWNCPLLKPPILSSGTILPATREMAFARAIGSAGVTYTLTKNCSSGILQNCHCSRDSKPQQPTDATSTFTHGGCTESFQFAEQVSRVFVDEKEGSRDATAYINLHNNEAGRQAVRRTMLQLCKCHGVSGSCATKTCWKKLPDFRAVGDYMKKKYTKALLADFHNGLPPRDVITYKYNNKASSGFNAIAIRTGELRKTSLVYLEPSPDYCRQNNTHATLGRQCMRSRDKDIKSRAERKSCTSLCRDCGLRVRKTTIQVESSCECKFFWCCAVKCNTCVEQKHILTCSLI